MKKVLISGVSGQLGSFIADIFLNKNYAVYGLAHHKLINNSNINLSIGDITDYQFMENYITTIQPDYLINCAAQSNVVQSFSNADYTMKATGDAVEFMLQTIQKYNLKTRFVTLGSALMFGNSPAPQDETTKFDSKSPYSQAKINAYNKVLEYRNQGLFACNAICFNSESYKRSEEYVSRKISKGVARIKYKLQDQLVLGNLESKRSFNHGFDVANGIYQIIMHNQPDDFIIDCGEAHSIKEFVEIAFNYCGLNYKDYIVSDKKYFRDGAFENTLCGNATKIKTILGWKPTYTFEQLVKEMVDYDLQLTKDSINE